MWTVVLAIALLALLLAVFLYGYLRSQFWVLFDSFPDSNPFQELPAGPKPDLVTDAKERDRVLKQSFSEDKVPAELDAIVIGSGMGGCQWLHCSQRVERRSLFWSSTTKQEGAAIAS